MRSAGPAAARIAKDPVPGGAPVALNVASLVLILFSVVIIVLGIVKIHEYPHRVAVAKNHPPAQAILVTSLLGLLVFPLWMAALVWAYAGVIGQPIPEPNHVPKSDEADSKKA
jgi:uncharacterized membrane protein YidH (DUF202 family)